MLEDKGYRRDQIRHLSRRYVRAVLFVQRNEDGLPLTPPTGKRPNHKSHIWQILFTKGWPIHKINEYLANATKPS